MRRRSPRKRQGPAGGLGGHHRGAAEGRHRWRQGGVRELRLVEWHRDVHQHTQPLIDSPPDLWRAARRCAPPSAGACQIRGLGVSPRRICPPSLRLGCRQQEQQKPAPFRRKYNMALNKKELEYFKNEMTWRGFADDAGAKVLVRGIGLHPVPKTPS
jgi:hypothetical protein